MQQLTCFNCMMILYMIFRNLSIGHKNYGLYKMHLTFMHNAQKQIWQKQVHMNSFYSLQNFTASKAHVFILFGKLLQFDYSFLFFLTLSSSTIIIIPYSTKGW